jgi:hypothetical protein
MAKSFTNDSAGMQKNIARLMVRRYLRRWVGSPADEDLLIALFMRSMDAFPDKPMKELVSGVDTTLVILWQELQQRGILEPDDELPTVMRMHDQFNAYVEQKAADS